MEEQEGDRELNGFEREGEIGRVESDAKGNPWMLICNWATSGTVVPRHAKLYLQPFRLLVLDFCKGVGRGFPRCHLFRRKNGESSFPVLKAFAID